MNRNTSNSNTTNSHLTRVLVVTDWDADVQSIVSACERCNERQPSTFQFVVPARLHGLDWAGNPTASVPCAHRQLEAITRSAEAAGLSFTVGGVGDPDLITAIADAVAKSPPDELLLGFRANRPHLSHPFDLARRARRLTGTPVERIRLAAAPGARVRGGRGPRLGGHCAAESVLAT